jgi:MYXO-CTERM domain-containing protein
MTATLLSGSRPAMRLGVLPGQKWAFTDLLWGMMLPSANDAAYAVAENTSGTLVEFAKAMNETARQLGMRESTFTDPSGLDSDTAMHDATHDGQNHVTAWDMAIAGRAVLANPLLASMASTVTHKFIGGDGKTYTLLNHNKLVRPASGLYYDGILGVKTGYTKAADGTFIGAAERNGRRLLVVVLQTADIYATSRALLDWGFSLPSTNRGKTKLPNVVQFPPGTRAPLKPSGIGQLADLPTPPPSTGPAVTTTTIAAQTPDTVEDPTGAEATVGSTAVVAAPVSRRTTSPDGSDSDTPAVVIGAAGMALLGVLTFAARRRLQAR